MRPSGGRQLIVAALQLLDFMARAVGAASNAGGVVTRGGGGGDGDMSSPGCIGGGERIGGNNGGVGGGVGGGGGGHTAAMPAQISHSTQRSSVQQWVTLQKRAQMSGCVSSSASVAVEAPVVAHASQPAHRVSRLRQCTGLHQA